MSKQDAVRVSTNTGSLLAGTVFRMAISLMFVVYAARVLGVDGFGKYALTQHYFELFVSLIASSIGILVTREIAKDPGKINKLVTHSVVLIASLSVMGAFSLVLLSESLAYAPETKRMLAVVCLALLPAGLSLLVEAVFIGFEAAHYVTIGTIVESAVRVGASVSALAMGYGLLSLIWILVATRVVVLGVYLLLLRQKVKSLCWDFEAAFFKRFVSDWKVFAVENWVSNLTGNLGVIFLSGFHGEAAVGLYVASVKILRLGRVVAASYTSAVYPLMSRLFEQSRESFHRLSEGSLKYMLVFVLPLVVAMSVLSDRIIGLLYTDGFAGAVPILSIVSWTLVLGFVNPFLSHTLFASGKQRQSLHVALINLGACLVMSFALIPRWAGVGTALMSVGSGGVAFFSYLLLSSRGDRARITLRMLAQTALPALGLGLFLVSCSQWNLGLLLAGGALLYCLLLFVTGLVSLHDMRRLQQVMRT